MKSGIFLLFTSVVTVMASPTPQVGETNIMERNPLEDIVQRASCKHPSRCSWFNSGGCEDYCDGYGGFDYMKGCGFRRKRCCCNKS